jgi:hypothetical protein
MSRRERSRAVSGGLRRPELAVSCAGSGCGGQRPKDAKAPVAPALLEPWSGFYAGGHAGGAWGNSTNASYSDKRLITERPDYAEANANYRKFAALPPKAADVCLRAAVCDLSTDVVP